MAEHDLNTPYGLLLAFLGDADNLEKVVIVAIGKNPNKNGKTDIIVGNTAMSMWEVMGLLEGAHAMKEVDFQNDYIDGQEGQDGDEGNHV